MYFHVIARSFIFPFFCTICLTLLEAAVYFQNSKSKYNSDKFTKELDLLIVGIV